MIRLQKFFASIQQDLKLFAALWLLICLYRIIFIWDMSSYLSAAADAKEIGLALWTGARLSLKSAGAITLLSFVFCSLAGIFLPRLELGRLRLWVGTAASFFLSVFFQARFPYYREFHMTYNMQVVQGWQDDRTALFWTMVQEYGLPWRLAVAVSLAVLFWYILKRLLQTPVFPLPVLKGKLPVALASLGLTAVIFVFGLFVRFGASFNYEKGINWENCGVTNDAFLNECILDDVQALYRARDFAINMEAGHIAGVDRENIGRYLRQIAGHEDLQAKEIKPYLARTAQGAEIPQPRHIFIILGESWAQWPMLDQYADLHAADGIRSLAAAPEGYATQSFLPNGEYTAIAITGMVTGLPEIHISPQYQLRTFKEAYPTAMAPQFKQLGYQVDFWYGGIPSWDSINRVALAQGFDHFYGYPDYNAPKQSAWGTKDGCMFDALEEHLADEPPTVHLIMTVTNHPPYNLDLAAEGFDLARAKAATAKLPQAENPDELAVELGHYWYMDKVVTEFVRKTQEKYPDSLFVITGDHAVRMDPGTQPTLFEHQSVPFVLYGQGVTKDILPAQVVGGHLNIVPTLLELIAPKGFQYYSLLPSMTRGSQAAFNGSTWLADGMIGQLEGSKVSMLNGQDAGDAPAARQKVDSILPAVRTIAWWLLQKGNSVEE